MVRSVITNARIYLPAFIGLTLSLMILFNPQIALTASRQGLQSWLTIVLPALLPFFVMAELLMGLGLVNFLGVLLEPIMKKVFKLPGTGGFVVAMSLSSGFPIGAKITGQLRREKLITKTEAERLICFANTADPLYMVGAVAVGMFGMPDLAISFLLAHYIGIIIVGLIMRCHQGEESPETPSQTPSLTRAFTRLAASKSPKKFGTLFSEAVKNAFNSMLFIGGCIMIFSVLVQILTTTGVIQVLTTILTPLLSMFGLNQEIITSLVSGIFEITIGTQSASLTSASLAQKAFAASWIMAWNGLSVHSQVAAMLYDTDISMKPFVFARFIHASIAGILTVIFIKQAKPVIASPFSLIQPTFLTRLWLSTKLSLVILGIILIIALVLKLYQRIILLWIR